MSYRFRCLLIQLLLLSCVLVASTALAQASPDQPPTPPRQAAPEAPKVDLPPETPLAEYDGGSVTFGEYQGWLAFIHREDEPEKRSDRIAAIAFNEAQAATALAMGLGTDTVVQMAQRDYASRLLHEELRRHWAATLELSADAVDKAFEEKQAAFGLPRRVRLRNLLKRYPEGSDEATVAAVRQRVEALRQQLVAGADFKTLAARESESQTRFRDGLIGWVTAGQMAEDLDGLVMAMQAGQLSPVLATGDGFTLLYCEAVEEAKRPSDEEIRRRIEGNLRKERFATLWQEQIESVAADAELDVTAAVDGRADAIVAKLPDGWQLSGAEALALVQSRGLHISRQRVAGLESLFRGFLEQHLAAQEARALGLQHRPDVQTLLHWSEVSTLSGEVERREVQKRFKPLTQEEVRAYFDAHRGRYRQPAQQHLAVIRMAADRSDLVQRFHEAEDLEEELRQQRISFADAAREHSLHGSAEAGGDAGWLSRTQIAALGPNVLKAVEELAAGELSGLIQQPEGVTGDHSLWIVQLLGSRAGRDLSFEEAATAAENGLGNERTRALQAQIRREVISRLNLRVAGSGSTMD